MLAVLRKTRSLVSVMSGYGDGGGDNGNLPNFHHPAGKKGYVKDNFFIAKSYAILP